MPRSRRGAGHPGQGPADAVVGRQAALDHRTSVDFDLFARRRFDPGDLVRETQLLRRGTLRRPSETQPDDEPTSPRSPRASGSGSGRGVGGVVVRVLDPRLRSAMVLEDGVRRIVINSRYPLYEVRRGDLWYQLETALREVCVTIPEATVPEFERKVNELMLVSLTVRPKRRKTGVTTRQVKGAGRDNFALCVRGGRRRQGAGPSWLHRNPAY